ncbi:MAG: thiamine pyrophosphate-dependent enzyme [Candidatus Omnitrophica bacterium]|nr:thiamine pyrophosphate-dependent enzyme [Candidatus Omnitrophota bacterium]MCM8791442.1 thiamine pyrophosphate-dependent enzyme [Candidatus Omnitrophota bacterium]
MSNIIRTKNAKDKIRKNSVLRPESAPSAQALKSDTQPAVVFCRPASLRDIETHYCAGCGHGIIHRLICEVIDELNIREKTIAVAPVGCAVIAYDYWDFDVSEAAHGRTPAVATGIKRVRPDNIVFTYQGDGDLAAIGTAEIVHAANRGENITVIFVNNGVYGMTGGQMAPTTLAGQKTATTLQGRSLRREGYPLKVLEMLAVLPGTKYLERVAVNSAQEVMRARRAIRKAFVTQMQGKGFSMVEVLSMCPTYWGMTPIQAAERIKNDVATFYPLGLVKG